MAEIRLLPMTYDMGFAVLEHGERGVELDPVHPDACLCGRESNYLLCDGPGLADMAIVAADNGPDLRVVRSTRNGSPDAGGQS